MGVVQELLAACLLATLSVTGTATADDRPAQSASQSEIERGANASSNCESMTWSINFELHRPRLSGVQWIPALRRCLFNSVSIVRRSSGWRWRTALGLSCPEFNDELRRWRRISRSDM
jgi:hypothetical protein